MSTTRKSTRVWIAKGAAAACPELVAWVVATALTLAPFAALAPSASAASYINTAVPSNPNLSSGLVLQYSFDGTKVTASTITDESGNGKNGILYPPPSVASTSVYSSSGSYSITVPTGATTLLVKMWGAGGGGGGGGGSGTGASGGGGGYASSSIAVTSGETLTVDVGGGGGGASAGCLAGTGAGSAGAGSTGPGGAGGNPGATGCSGPGGGGGGGSFVKRSSTKLIAAGGGGGGGGTESGGGPGAGGGGGVNGSNGGGSSVGGTAGGSGTSAGTAGTQPGIDASAGGGGGGGYLGGTGGGAPNVDSVGGAGGGGGTNYGTTITNGSGTVPGNSGDADRGTAGSGGAAQTAGNAGLIKLIFNSAGATSVLRTPGRIGQAISFNGITASTTIGNVSSTVKSVAFWAKVATSTTQQNIIDLNGSGANIEIVNGVVTANGFTSPTIYVDGAVSSTLNDRNWHHVVVTTGTNVNASNVNLGVVGGVYYGGSLDDLRLYNRALSASEAKRLYQLGATSYINTAVPSNPNLSSGLVLQYSFDGTKVTASTITDESGNGKTGTPSTGYQFFRTVTIDHTKVPNTDQTNFPVLFSGTYSYLKTTANGGNVTNASGYDIIFSSSSSCATKLDHEIETYAASTGAVNLWVRVPTVSHTTDTVIYLCYGNSAISTSQENKTGVWDTNFKGVWHLPNGTTLTALDSTGVNNGTLVNTPTAGTGKADGGAILSKAASSYISVVDAPSLDITSAITIEAWVYPTTLSTEPAPGLTGIVSKYNSTTNSADSYMLRVGRYPTNNTDLNFAFLDSGLTERNVFGTTVSLNTWQHVVATFNGTTLLTYQNGTQTGSASFTGSINAGSSDLTLGIDYIVGSPSNARNFTGTLDEIRVSGSARSADWIATEYNNQNSPSTFYTLGAAAAGSSVLRTPGRIGQAISFNGITASTTIGNVSSTVKSVAFWAKVATSTTQQNIIDLNGSGANIEIVNGVVTANGFTSPTIYVDGAVSSTLNDKNWHHVVVTTGTNVNASNVNLGVVGGVYYGGALDDLRLYNRALSASEAKRLYQLGATSYINTAVPSNPNLSSGLVLQYSFDGTKVSTTTITDESGNGKNGALYLTANPQALVVGGGGGGGGGVNGVVYDAGGGGGEVIYNSSIAVTVGQAYTVTVGGGGAGAGNSPGGNGADSVFSTITARGGKGGGTVTNGKGGKSGNTTYDGGINQSGSAAGGGGGNSQAGSNGITTAGGKGGDGTANSISGSSVYYGGGGGGRGSSTDGAGGAGGGGAGQQVGTANTGGGGGGSASGGSGVVIISYPTGSRTATGGTITTSGGNTIHTFNSGGTFTPTSIGGIRRTPGRIGQAISFNGITASTTIGNVSSTVKSVAFWAKVATSTTQQNIIDLNGSGANIEIVNGVVTANGFTSPTIYVDGAVSSTLNDKNWHHVVVTTGTNVNASNVNLGVVGGVYYGGALDDLRLYNRALSAAEAKRLYQLGN